VRSGPEPSVRIRDSLRNMNCERRLSHRKNCRLRISLLTAGALPSVGQGTQKGAKGIPLGFMDLVLEEETRRPGADGLRCTSGSAIDVAEAPGTYEPNSEAHPGVSFE
jgi:hypothetical protein